MAKVRLVKPKKGCCKSRPRCKRCPVVCKRLATQEMAVRRKDGKFVILEIASKKAIKAARA